MKAGLAPIAFPAVTNRLQSARIAVSPYRHHGPKNLCRSFAQLLLLVPLTVTSLAAVTVTDRMVTKAVNTASCTAPTPSMAFLTTDQSAWIWFNVGGANAGDLPSGNWYAPNGTIYKSITWNPVASAGGWCFFANIDIAGNPPASNTGNWSVGVSWNGSTLFTLPFTVSAPSAGGLDRGPWPTQGHDNRRSNQSDLIGPQSSSSPKLIQDMGAPFIADLAVTSDGKILAASCPPQASSVSSPGVLAFNGAGTVLWNFGLGTSPPEGAVGVSVSLDGKIYVATHDCPDIPGPIPTNLYAVQPNGAPLWSRTQGAMYLPGAIGTDGTIYQMDELTKLRAYSPDGSLVWSRSLVGFSQGAIAIDATGNLYVGTDGGVYGSNSFWSLTPTGSVRWSVGKGSLGTPVISPAGNIYVTDSNGNLFAYNSDGSQRWSYSAGGAASLGPLAVGASETVYFQSSTGLFAVTSKGTLKWKYASGGPSGSPAPVLDSGENVYVAFGDTVASLNSAGVLQWSTPVPAAGRLVLGAPGTLYVVSASQRVYALTSASTSQNSIAVSNAASFDGTGSVAPGEIVAIFGSGLGPASPMTLQLDSNGRVSSSLGGTRVLFDAEPAPLIFVSANQLGAVVPYSTAGRPTTTVHVEYQGNLSDPLTLTVTESVPGIFSVDASGKSQGAIVNQDNSINSLANPALSGSIVSLYATGEGQTDPPGVDGQVSGDVLPKPRLPVSVAVGGTPATVLYAGAAPGAVAGVFQVNFRVPETTTASGAVPLSLTVGNATSQPGITMAVSLSLQAVGLSALTLSPSSLTGGTLSIGTVSLTNAAPPGGAVITLRSNGNAATVPASVTVPAGETSAGFVVATSSVTSIQAVTITASYGNDSRSTTLTINPAALALTAVSLSSSSVTGGSSVTGSVRLSAAAPSGGAVVSLRSSSTVVGVPATLTVLGGASSATFTVTTNTVTSPQTVTITATYNSATQTVLLTVNPASTLSPWTSGSITLDGTLTVEGQSAHVQIMSSYVIIGYLATVTTMPGGSNAVIVDIVFDQNATPSGNSITYTGVNSLGSNYINLARGANVEPIVSGTMTLTIAGVQAGATASGTITFSTSARTLTASFAGTVLSIN
jgi:uncharacterized protein (TIGR03437 family)